MALFHFIDKKTGESIPNVQTTIQLLNANASGNDTVLKIVSDKKGKVVVRATLNSLLLVSSSHSIYEDFRQGYRIKDNTKDTLNFEIVLKPSTMQYIKEVVIKAPGIPDTIYGSDKLSVADFEIQKNGKLILLTYPKQLKNGSEIILFDGKEVLSTFPLSDIPEKLIRDFRGNTHVLCENEILTIVLAANEVQVASIEKDYFLQ